MLQTVNYRSMVPGGATDNGRIMLREVLQLAGGLCYHCCPCVAHFTDKKVEAHRATQLPANKTGI